MNKIKQVLGVLFVLSLVLLGGCETVRDGSSNGESTHQHGHH